MTGVTEACWLFEDVIYPGDFIVEYPDVSGCGLVICVNKDLALVWWCDDLGLHWEPRRWLCRNVAW